MMMMVATMMVLVVVMVMIMIDGLGGDTETYDDYGGGVNDGVRSDTEDDGGVSNVKDVD